jgi:hypothetical protein
MDEIFADYNDMIYADSRPQIEAKRKAFFRSAVANSLEEVGDKLFIFTHFSKSQWSRLRSHRRVAPLRVAHRTSIRTSKSDASATGTVPKPYSHWRSFQKLITTSYRIVIVRTRKNYEPPHHTHQTLRHSQ